jgi:hypothetical protein
VDDDSAHRAAYQSGDEDANEPARNVGGGSGSQIRIMTQMATAPPVSTQRSTSNELMFSSLFIFELRTQCVPSLKIGILI